MDAKLAKTYQSPGGYWEGLAAIPGLKANTNPDYFKDKRYESKDGD